MGEGYIKRRRSPQYKHNFFCFLRSRVIFDGCSFCCRLIRWLFPNRGFTGTSGFDAAPRGADLPISTEIHYSVDMHTITTGLSVIQRVVELIGVTRPPRGADLPIAVYTYFCSGQTKLSGVVIFSLAICVSDFTWVFCQYSTSRNSRGTTP